ncbi:MULTISPECIES: L-threonylcarbamoyladenylate synthase [unclassified Paenibacillus]|nr:MULTISPECIES: L-threonylcarbamoyladenylate synthase [unclassified Paenibacillus]MCM3128343.1 L-threonylcarbamoyladenylate synthase [Paenibacillus sp. MER 78]
MEHLEEAAKLLRDGFIVAFPTETVYGLGADARNTTAVEAVFEAKGRPSDNPLIVHIANREQLSEFVSEINELSEALMNAYWPGPLTIILPLKPEVLSARVTAGLDTVGVRMPDHPVALQLLALAGCPVAAPSANRSGRPSPTLAEHVQADLDGRIEGIVDGGATGVGVESTVVQADADGTVTILRPGGITEEQLRTVASEVRMDPGLAAGNNEGLIAPRSPGMKYTHYAPKGSLCIVDGDASKVKDYIASRLHEAKEQGEITAVLAFSEHIDQYQADGLFSLGSMERLAEGAHLLYAALRSCDEIGASYILAEACPSEGLGAAIMNRLLKAAGHQIIHVT